MIYDPSSTTGLSGAAVMSESLRPNPRCPVHLPHQSGPPRGPHPRVVCGAALTSLLHVVLHQRGARPFKKDLLSVFMLGLQDVSNESFLPRAHYRDLLLSASISGCESMASFFAGDFETGSYLLESPPCRSFNLLIRDIDPRHSTDLTAARAEYGLAI